jgi:hypothetical protein
MRYLLTQLKVDEEATKRLVAAGITDTDTLLQHAAFPEQRQMLETKLELQPERILKLAGIADLLRIKGLGIKLARFIVLEYPTVQDIATSSSEEILSSLQRHDLASYDLSRLPAFTQISEIVNESRELKIRLVKESLSFPAYEKIMESEKKSSSELSPFAKIVYKLDALLMIGIFLLSVIFAFVGIDLWPIRDWKMFIYLHFVEFVHWCVFVLSAFIMGGILWLVWRSFTFTGTLWWHFLGTKLKPNLFNKPIYLKFFAFVNTQELPLATQKKMFATAMIVILVGAFFSAITWLLSSDYQVSFWIILISISLGFPILMLVEIQKMWNLSDHVIEYPLVARHRYLIWKIVNWISIPILLLFLFQLLYWGSQAQTAIVRHGLLPSYNSLIRTLVSNMPSFTVEDINSQFIIENFRYKYAHDLSEDDMEIALLEPLLSDEIFGAEPSYWIGNLVAVLTFLSCLVFIVYPLFILKKARAAIIILALIVLSFLTDQAISNFPKVFFWSNNLLVTSLLAISIIIATTLFIDWLQDEYTEEYRLCIVCGHALDTDYHLCPRCENPQPDYPNRIAQGESE